MKDEFMNHYQETQEEIMENIFISWSGKKSKDVASKIKLWLPKVIPSIRPWMSEDIEAGKRWSPEIAKQLSDSRLGIICVTRENMNSGWLLFEAGAISKELDDDTRIYPILIDLPLSDLKYPLAQFQAIELTQDGSNILKLVSSLNQITKHPFPPSVVTILFEYYWPELKEQIFEIKEFSYSYSDVYRFQNISDQIFFDDLFGRIDYNEITSIDILGHTGENLIKGFLGVLSANKKLKDCLIEKQIIIRILLRDPISEVSGRVLGIKRTLEEIQEFQRRGLQLQLNFYQNLPIFRSILFRFRKADPRNKDNQKGFISFYYFPTSENSKRYPQRLLVDNYENNKNQIIEIYDSWFNYFWGKSNDYREIHTIILDFDDTIIESHGIQIKAWVELIEHAIKDRKLKTKELEIGNSHEKIIFDEKNINGEEEKEKLYDIVKKIFFSEQMASKIFDKIFSIDDKDLKDELHQKRFNIRQGKMVDVEPFPEVVKIIRKISEKYNLVIISATDENIIKDYLCQPSFMAAHKPFYDCFKYVFGKREPDFKWQNMDRKSQLIHKITSLIGVPVERMVYVGDNNMDFEAASRINIDFIEARLFSDEVEKSIGKKSLINVDNSEHPHFISWSEFCEKLEEIEKFKEKRRKEQYGF